MKPDGVTMETTEPTETAAAAEPSSLQDNITEQARSRQEEGAKNAARRAAPKANGKSRTTEPKVKPKATVTKSQSTTKSAGVSGSFSRPTTASHRTVNNAKSSDNTSAAAGKKLTTAAAKASLAGAVSKRPISVAAVSTAAKSQTRMPDKKSVAPPRTTSFGAPTATNGTKLTSVNGTIGKRPATETVNVARSKTTATTSRTVASNSSKPSTSTTSKAVGATTSKTTRPATALSASRPTTTTSRPTATTKPSTTATAKTTVSRVNTAPSTGRSTAAPPPRTTAAKKDVSRPVSTAVAKKPTAATASAATKKPETSKPTATVKVDSASKWSLSTKAADTKLSQTKPQQPAKPAPAKKPVAVERVCADNKLPIGQPPSASSANKPANGTVSKTKRGTKPTQAVPPFTATKKANVSKATAQCATGTRTLAPTAAAVATTATLADARGEATVPLPLGSFHAASTSEDLSAPVLAQDTIPEVLGPACVLMEPTPLTSAPLPTENAVLQVIPPTNLNEDEEEKECSPLVSVSEMSGTTQPTEESRPGSAGLVGGSVWRASGPLLSELDSEEVSGSQQGASELSAPGVLEGTESMDDLGDGSLKGAIDMEGASAGSPDFEKVPDIPVNDFDEDDDEDEDDRVCDMDVGSERADEPQRPRHDNDVDDDDDDDDDVEMASEGVTESGLESYGNADEDDFAEDERLDNLNRLAQPPPPPPMLPSAPAAQWHQPNPFANPWAEPIDQGLHAIQGARAAVTSPLANPWQADSETPTQSPAQAWLELGSAPLVPENQEIPQYSSVKGEPQNLAVPMSIDQISPAPVQTLTSGTPGMSLSSTLSSETSTPEELGDYNREGNLQPQAPLEGAQPDLAVQLDRGEGEEEADTLPADDVLGGPATAPTSNPSSPSVTEDEASDTEGEAQLGDSSETPRVIDITFDCQPSTRRCLSTVEEAEEPEMASTAGEDATLLSASFSVTYGFDATITASNSNAQSAGESCIKSPGIFSLEELPEEAKESGFIPPPSTHLAEQQYIERGKQEVETAEHGKEEVLGSEEAPIPSSTLCTLQQPEENTDAIQAPYYSAICEKTEDSFAGFTTIPHPHRRDNSAYPGAYHDVVKAPGSAGAPPRLTCADLPPRNLGQQALSPQLRRLEQHQRQLLELQQRREQQHRPLEEAEQERKRREEEEQKKKKDEAEEEIKRNKQEEEELRSDEELKQRQDLELQLQQQQEELKQRQQIMQWQQELQQSNKGQTVLLSPSSGLCTIYEALENSDEEGMNELNPVETKEKIEPQHDASYEELGTSCERLTSHEDQQQDSLLCDSPPPLPGSPQSSSNPSQDGDTPDSPERPPPLELDWGKKVDIVQQLINQTLLLNQDGCSSLMLLPGGAGGTLSPLESSLWPSLLPPLTPPSATVTSVSSFSPEAAGSSPQGEWTVVELETHH